MKNKGEIIPIGRGKEIRIEEKIEKVKTIQKKYDALYQRVKDAIDWREKLKEQELKNSAEKINYALLESLEKELTELNAIEDRLMDEIFDSWDAGDKLRQEWLRALDESELMVMENLIQELKQRVKELPGENSDK